MSASQIQVLIAIGIALVALLYSSVGHGGASGYLAVLAFAGLEKEQLSSTSLVLNLVVASLSAIAFARAKHLRWSLALPFLLGSLPFAFIGGRMKVSDTVYYILLGVVLVAAGLRMLIPMKGSSDTKPPTIPVAVGAGAGIGLFSGIVGVGGGIFLSPIAILLRWMTAKEASAVAAVFILGNSLAGLAGRVTAHTLSLPTAVMPCIPCALAGGLVGSYIGAQKLDNRRLQSVLGVVLLVAAVKLIVSPG